MLQTFSRMGGTKGQLLLWLLIFSSSHRYCCKNINQLNLTSLPTALITNTPDTRILNLSDNLIEEVDEFPTNDYVEKLFIRRNILKSFPNVVNLDQTLITLDLRENAISYIHPERLRPLFNLQKLILIDNLINDMPDMDPVLGSNIVELKLILNKLTSLPYLPVIGENLQHLDVERNDQLVSADPDVFSAYPKVTYLDVSLCPLGNLPDVHRLPTETHNHALFLKFEGIGMSKMTPEQMAFFDKELWTLDLSDNSIPHIPNMLHLNLSTPIIFLRNPVVCDCRVRWLLYMRDAGLDPAFDLTTVICDRPITLQNQSLASITLADIDCLDNKQRETVVTSFPALSVGATVPPVSRIIPGLTTLECAAQCLQERACVAFATSAAPKEYHCALTNASARSGGSPEAIWGDSVTQWFALDT